MTTAEITCGECGICFHVPEGWQRQRKQEGGTFYCPNGHPRVYRETDVEALTGKLKNAEQQIARAEDEAREAKAESKRIEARERRLKKRMSAGTCPCCQRTFSNMSTHMKRQHPEFVTEQGAKVVPIKRPA